MEIENAILQDLERFGKERGFSTWPWKSLDFCVEKFLIICICYVCHFTNSNAKHNPPKNYKMYHSK